MEHTRLKQVTVKHPSQLAEAILDALNELHDKRIISIITIKNDLCALIYFK